jgi:hypothetical protein
MKIAIATKTAATVGCLGEYHRLKMDWSMELQRTSLLPNTQKTHCVLFTVLMR